MGQKYSSSQDSISIKKRLSKSNLEEFDLSKHKSLQIIEIRNTSLESIPASICQSIKTSSHIADTLTELHLCENKLKTIPDEICLLYNLRCLNLEKNQLIKLPFEIPCLYKLEKLLLSSNKLEFLPPNMKNMRNLKVLELHNNNLKFIPDDVGEMVWLEELTLFDNADLDEQLNTVSYLDMVLDTIALNKNINPKYKKQHDEYLEIIEIYKKNVEIYDGLNELKDIRMKSFLKLLSRQRYFDEFCKFLKKEYAEESLMFYKDVVEFRKEFNSDYPIRTKEVYEVAYKIYCKYIKENSEFAINIPSEIKNKIDQTFYTNNVDQFLFTDAKVCVLKLMLNDNFGRFIETDEGRRIWNKVKSRSERSLASMSD